MEAPTGQGVYFEICRLLILADIISEIDASNHQLVSEKGRENRYWPLYTFKLFGNILFYLFTWILCCDQELILV